MRKVKRENGTFGTMRTGKKEDLFCITDILNKDYVEYVVGTDAEVMAYIDDMTSDNLDGIYAYCKVTLE